MALLPITGLETHPTGTIDLNAIINGNWTKLEAKFAEITGNDGLTTIAYAATIAVALKTSKPLNQCILAGDVSVTFTEKAAGLSRILILWGDDTERTVSWPAGAVWSGGAVATVPVDGVAVVLCMATGTDDADLLLVNLAGGGSGATPAWSPSEEGLAAQITTDDEDLALDGGDWSGFAGTPAGRVDVLISQSRFATVGDGAKNRDCYFSADGGTTALPHADIADALTLHWMGSIAGYELSSADTITFRYSTV